MSGKHCPDCRGNVFAPRGESHQCQLCGWTGDISVLPNSAYQPIFYERLRERYNTVLAGKIFIVRIVCTKKDVEQVKQTIQDVFGTDAVEKELETGIEIRITSTTAPTKEQIKLLATTGKVTVFPEVTK